VNREVIKLGEKRMGQLQLFENDNNILVRNYMNRSSISDIDVSSENQIEIYKDIEFELEKLLDLRKTQKETEKSNILVKQVYE